MANKHAVLSASSAGRWIACPPSARLNAAKADTPSEYAAQGTDAHALCEYKLRKALGEKVRDPSKKLATYDSEMEECAEAYSLFVMGLVSQFREEPPKLHIQREGAHAETGCAFFLWKSPAKP